jgi:NTE family protein
VTIGWPLGNRLKAVINATGFNTDDHYSNDKKFISGDTLDALKFLGVKAGVAISANDLDRKQYASSGKSFSLIANYFNGKETYEPGNTSDTQGVETHYRQWFRISGTAEQYFNWGWYRPGYIAQATFSNQPAFSNYAGTIINAPAFLPIQDSPTLILENFRAFNYLAFGLRNVFVIKRRLLDLRIEGYAFKPLEQILEGTNQEVVLNSEITTVFFAGTAGLVMHTPVGPLSLSVNYYDDTENQLGVLLHIGFLLFNKQSIEH